MKNKLIVSTGSLFALLLWSNSSFAACTLDSRYVAQNVIMDMGTVTLNPDTPVGQILARKSFNILGKDSISSCGRGGGSWIGILSQNKPAVSGIHDTYETNVAGIGIRLFRNSGAIQTYYPHQINYSEGSTVSLVAGTFDVEIIKTASQTGTGSLSSGLYSNYYTDGSGSSRPILTSTLNAEGIIITNPTCIYRDNTDGQTVELDKVGVQELTGVGSVAKQKDFWLKLTCNGGNTTDQKLNLTFTYTPDSLAGANGVMKNTTGTGYATGVGVQILKDDATTKVKNGDKLSVATINRNTASNPELKLKARYYQTEAQVTAGKVFTTATVTISYE